MESVEKGKVALIASIESDAQAEEQKIIAEAEKQAAEKREYAEKKVESILNESRQKAEEQSRIIKHKTLADVESEIKRAFLREQDVIMHDITGMAEKQLYSMMDEPDYRDILRNWITEAAIGLDVESAEINASKKELALIDEKMLSEVKEKIGNGGKKINLTLSKSSPLEFQGVVLTATNGRVAFNNQVRTRFLRSQRKIRTMIYNSLFSDNQK